MTERSHMLIDIATVLSLGPPKAKATGSNPVGCASKSTTYAAVPAFDDAERCVTLRRTYG